MMLDGRCNSAQQKFRLAGDSNGPKVYAFSHAAIADSG
jgi:hypothetical protein